MAEINRKRDKLEIIEDLLLIIQKYQNKIKPTPLMRYANLSSASFQEYVNELLDKELIEVVIYSKRKHYALTQKGVEFIQQYQKLKGLIAEFNL